MTHDAPTSLRSDADTDSAPLGTVRIVGSGLLGASLGLALTGRGVDVALCDALRSHMQLAVDYGAGREVRDDDDPVLIVVATPPDTVADVVAAELARFPDAIVTDVASVKVAPLTGLRAHGADLSRYVGSHPMAGRERGGPLSARGDLFVGRPWIVCRTPETTDAAVALVERVVTAVDAQLIEMDPEEHDRAVALVSHLPQVVSTVLAGRLRGAPDAFVALAGQGLRDTVRIATGDPSLWSQILGANADAVGRELEGVLDDLEWLRHSLSQAHTLDGLHGIADAMADGNEGVARLPGKHGQDRRYASVVVLVDDRPGELARLLTELGEMGVNLEDLRLEHSPGAQIGLAEITVLPDVKERTVEDLADRGWRIAGE